MRMDVDAASVGGRSGGDLRQLPRARRAPTICLEQCAAADVGRVQTSSKLLLLAASRHLGEVAETKIAGRHMETTILELGVGMFEAGVIAPRSLCGDSPFAAALPSLMHWWIHRVLARMALLGSIHRLVVECIATCRDAR